MVGPRYLKSTGIVFFTRWKKIHSGKIRRHSWWHLRAKGRRCVAIPFLRRSPLPTTMQGTQSRPFNPWTGGGGKKSGAFSPFRNKHQCLQHSLISRHTGRPVWAENPRAAASVGRFTGPLRSSMPPRALTFLRRGLQRATAVAGWASCAC